MLRSVDTAAPNPDDALLPAEAAKPSAASEPGSAGIARPLLESLWTRAEAGACGLAIEEFGGVLAAVGARHNFGLPAGAQASTSHRETFFCGLRLGELAMAHACARGKEAAWERFLRAYRATLMRAATAITGSASLGEELADSLHAELYGLRETDGERRSPFASYSGRGSLEGWLRASLAQRFRDHHRRTRRESPLEEADYPSPVAETPVVNDLGVLTNAVARTLVELGAEERFLLSAYFLDQHTLLEIARVLGVHEATISRRLKRLVGCLRRELRKNLERGGLSKREAEEALGADPRDLEINLRAVLQGAQVAAFKERMAARETAATDTV
jgi:RNA polymerase sigma-70 factor, ECF subfamily